MAELVDDGQSQRIGPQTHLLDGAQDVIPDPAGRISTERHVEALAVHMAEMAKLTAGNLKEVSSNSSGDTLNSPRPVPTPWAKALWTARSSLQAAPLGGLTLPTSFPSTTALAANVLEVI